MACGVSSSKSVFAEVTWDQGCAPAPVVEVLQALCPELCPSESGQWPA